MVDLTPLISHLTKTSHQGQQTSNLSAYSFLVSRCPTGMLSILRNSPVKPWKMTRVSCPILRFFRVAP
jgi:hypothetical protein